MAEINNVCLSIAQTGLCSGCGICAAACPHDALNIQWNAFGEYQPVLFADKCISCKLCLKVCPFSNDAKDEDSLAKSNFTNNSSCKHSSLLGCYDELFAGFSPKDRENSASGGLTSWFLKELMTNNKVDAVCCVRATENPSALFETFLANNVEELELAQSSVYYPVEFSQIIKKILQEDKKIAVVALPCVIKALRNFALYNKKLNTKIPYMIGLVCGQQKSKFFSEYMCALKGVDHSKVIDASFRNKDYKRHHLDHSFRFRYKSDKSNELLSKEIFQSEGMSYCWGHDYFKFKACNYCDDITAELADLSCGDAIKEPYCCGNEGANFVISRKREISELLLKAQNSERIKIQKVSCDVVEERQEGVALLKRSDLAFRLYIDAKQKKEWTIGKRVSPKKRKNLWLNIYMHLRDYLRENSRIVFADNHDCHLRIKKIKEMEIKSKVKFFYVYMIELFLYFRKKIRGV